MGISQVQLNYLATASDLGKALGWSSGLALMYLPLSAVLFIAALAGLIGYGLQWLLIQNLISLPYFLVFILCLLSGCSICWFNTVCFVLCIKNFPTNRALALSLTISFNGVSPALYTLLANAISSTDNSLYLILNSLVPFFTSFAALVPILRQPPLEPLSTQAARRDSLIFLILNVLAVFTGLYLLVLNSFSFSLFTARLLFTGAILLLLLPLGIPGIVYARQWARRTIHTSFQLHGSGFNLVEVDDLELHRELLGRQEDSNAVANPTTNASPHTNKEQGCCDKDRLTVLGEEHPAHLLVLRTDFWLYYLTYLCGGTIGLVYSNNLGQIAQSLGDTPNTTTLVTLYSTFSFFGRLLSAVPDFMRGKVYFARTGWLAIALVPTPVAFFMLAASANEAIVQAGTAFIGLSSGFIFAAAVSVTSELFGPNSVGVNHNILITNIPVGSLMYGLLAAMVYDGNVGLSVGKLKLMDSAMVCMGRQCYWETFIWWGCISMLGLASSLLLFFRTRLAYHHFEQNRITAYDNTETT